MKLSRQNQRLLFTLILAIVVAAVIGRLIEKGVSVVGEKERVLALADELVQCTNQQEYIALLHRHYPPDSRLWKAPAMIATDQALGAPVTLEVLPDGRLKVVVFALRAEQLLETGSYVYLPATLVDNLGRGHKIEDVRLNSRKDDLVFEYVFSMQPAQRKPLSDQKFQFFFGLRHWELIPRPGQ